MSFRKEALEEASADTAEHIPSGSTFSVEHGEDETEMVAEEVDMSELPPELKMDQYDDDEIDGNDEDDDDEYAVSRI